MLKRPGRACTLFILFLLVSFPTTPVFGQGGEKKKILISEVTFYPSDVEEGLGRAFEKMLETRLFPYFSLLRADSGESESWDYILTVSLTRIGDGVSIDILLSDKMGGNKRRYFTGEDSGEIPKLLEELSESLVRIAYGGKARWQAKAVGKEERIVPLTSTKVLPEKYAESLPRGKFKLSPSFGGGYYLFSGGDVNRDGSHEIVAVREGGLTIINIEDEVISDMFTYDLEKNERVIYLSCGDVNRDRRVEVVATIAGSYGVRGMVLYYDEGEKTFHPIDFPDSFLKIYSDRERGSVLLSQHITSGSDTVGEVEFIMLRGREIERLWAMPLDEGVSIEHTTPVWFNESYGMLDYGSGSIRLRGAEIRSFDADSVVEDVRTVDLDGDGNQEILVFSSMVQRSIYFESLTVKRGFAVEVFGIDERGLYRDYRFENESVKAGGFFPRFSSKGAIEEFVVVALQGNDFFPPSVKWKEIRIR